jgi:hypothetical protein
VYISALSFEEKGMGGRISGHGISAAVKQLQSVEK